MFMIWKASMAAVEDESLEETPKGRTELLLPVSRIRIIMKSSPDVENVAQDALNAVTGATELFIKDLTRKVYSTKTAEDNSIDYNDLAAVVNSQDIYGFLDEIVPQKVLGRDILGLSKKNDGNENGHSSANEENDEKSEDEEGKSEEEDL